MDMSPASQGRMLIALGGFGLLAGCAWFTMEPGKFRTLALLFLAFFAFRVVLLRLRSR